jgi:hypothetical protein
MKDETKFRKSFDDLMKEIISKRASMSPELKFVVEMIIDHEHRLIEYETKLTRMAEEMTIKIDMTNKQLMTLFNERNKRHKWPGIE